MKSRTILKSAIFASITATSLLVWSAVAKESSNTPDTSDPTSAAAVGKSASENPDESSISPYSAAERAEIAEAKAEIVSRAKIASCQEISEPGDNGIDEAYDSGIIVDATLEEVEAALAAAAATPSKEDDIAALRLAHRGSYRYFQKSSATGISRSHKN